MLVQVARKDTASVVDGLTRQVQQLPNEMRKSLTWDRGTELAQHKRFTVAPMCRFTSATLKVHGNGAVMKTPMGCYAHTSRRA